jgi:TolB-like protein/DNA-binding winged helix-turn-helix (wHTH) protein
VPTLSYKFADFHLDTARFELRRNGQPQRLERIPMELLILLLENGGQLVSRQEIVGRVWGKDVFVDTEHGINTAIRKIRTALGEDGERPRFIQTISGKGYRFVAEVARSNGESELRTREEQPSAVPPPAYAVQIGRKRAVHWLFGAAIIVLAGVLLDLNVGGVRDRILGRSKIGPIHTLAVLPLTNLSGDSSQDYYVDGMTDELITALARNHSLRVVSRTSAMRYKSANKPLRDIARELGVDGILEGSVSRSGNNVHVNLQLIYAPTDTHVWAESYDRDLNSAMTLPDELAQTIATAARVEPAPAKPKRYVSPEAHDAYLQGRLFWFAENGDRGRSYFEKAVQLQPDYAAAWDGLSDSYGVMGVVGAMPPRKAFAKLQEYVRKAFELDPDLPEVHNSLAATALFYEWNWSKAEEQSLRAIELNPNYAEARFVHSYILLVTNRDKEALEEEKRANDLAPFERPWALGLLYVHLRQYDAAINELQSRANTLSQNAFVRSFLSESYWLKGMWKDSEREEEEAHRLWGDPKGADELHRAFEQGGEEAVERLGLTQTLARARKGYVPSTSIAIMYAGLHDKEHSLHYLEAAYREHAPLLIFLQKEPMYDFLHSDPRYQALVKKIGLPPAY